jgi:hypothetical protein
VPTIDRAEQIERFETANSAIAGGGDTPLRDAQGRIEARCAHPDCRRFLPHPEMSGAAARVQARRWWCSEHRTGREADFEPYTGPKLAYSRTGAIVDLDEVEREAERVRAAAESHRAQRAHRDAQRVAEAEELRKVHEAERELIRRETPREMPVP